MIDAPSFLNQLAGYLMVVLLPILALYIVYLIVTNAFRDMGFSSLEAIVIVFVSFLLGAGIIDEYIGISFSNIHLFTYHEYWLVGINIGGAVIPILLSIYLFIKNKLKVLLVFLGILIIAIISFFVTYPDPERGIVSSFPHWMFPIIIASLVSVFLYWKEKRKAAPLAYIIGTLGVLIGADCFHLISLLENEVNTTRNAIIGGANVFDMVFITGILAVFLDGLLLFQEKRKKE
jgi:uncharacterized membrane protein